MIYKWRTSEKAKEGESAMGVKGNVFIVELQPERPPEIRKMTREKTCPFIQVFIFIFTPLPMTPTTELGA